jgi:hypothetical protein
MEIKVTTWLQANLILSPHYDVNQQCVHIVHLFSSWGGGGGGGGGGVKLEN